MMGRRILKIIKNKYIRAVFIILFIAVIAATLFIRTPRTDIEIQEFIAQSQIDYPLPEGYIIGFPQHVMDKTGTFVSSPPDVGKSKRLKITKRDGKFYWDSWKEQELKVIRGRRYFSGHPVPSTVFISEESDGMIVIDNGVAVPEAFCGMYGGGMFGARASNYIETRSPIDAEVEVIKGHTGSYYPYGSDAEICVRTGHYSHLYYKPSLYQRIKELFFQE